MTRLLVATVLVMLLAPAARAQDPPLRPQEPRPPLPYRAEEVRYPNPVAGIQLAGTLTTPDGAGPFPAVVLISGSGQQNRDSDLFGHRSFLVLADYLTRRGIAVLRADDRGIGASGGVFEEATTADFAADVQAGVQYLRTRPEVRADEIGLVGMSEGGLVAPMVAATPDAVAFVVLLGAPGMRGEEVLYRQGELIARAMGVPDAQIEYNRRVQSELFAVIVAEADPSTRALRMEEVLRAQFAALTEAERAAAGITRAGEDEWIRRQLRTMGGPWFRFFLMHDPLPILGRVRVPVLAMGGALDLQVPSEPNLRAIESALRGAGNTDVTVVSLPGLNHLLQTARSGIPAEYSEIPETMSPAAMERIASWILERGGRW